MRALMCFIVFLLSNPLWVAGQTLVGFSATPPSPQAPGTVIQFFLTAIGGIPPLQYKFWIFDGQVWRVGREWSTDPAFQWTTPPSMGRYLIGGWARNVGSITDWYDNNVTVQYAFDVSLLPPAPPVVPPPESPPIAAAPMIHPDWGPTGCRWVTISAAAPVPSYFTDPTGQAGIVKLDGLPAYAPGWAFPFIVPADHWFGLTDASLASKRVNYSTASPGDPPGYRPGLRSSYLVLYGVTTLPEHAPHRSWRTPLVLPPGFTLTGQFTNAGPETQNMLASLSGWLSPEPTFAACR